MDEILETAADFYRALKKRGLHLRKNNGRDNFLLSQLASKVGCPNLSLQKFLDRNIITAEEFLLHFIDIAQPFALMFKEIWQFLSENCAPKTQENISVRFGFKYDKRNIKVDLETFRRYIQSSEEILGMLKINSWGREAAHKLFELARILEQDLNNMPSDYERYNPGRTFNLPQISIIIHDLDRVVQEIRQLFQKIIYDYARHCESDSLSRNLPELSIQDNVINESNNLRDWAFLLTDLLPKWYNIFQYLDYIGSQTKEEALSFFKKEIKPLIGQEIREGRGPLLKALDILDLPFWRHRWHTYEIWASILTLKSLKNYSPNPVIVDNSIPIDGYKSAIIAYLTAKEMETPCAAIQVQTKLSFFGRKGIKPDLRLYYSDNLTAEQTALIIEFKQRAFLKPKYVNDLCKIYQKGCPNAGGVIILNYDETGTKTNLPFKCQLIEGVYPDNNECIEKYYSTISDMLKSVGFIPDLTYTVVLLDVSGSMGRLYDSKIVQDALHFIILNRNIKIYRFNNGLVPGGDLDETECQQIETGGGTQLGKAIDDLEAYFGLPEKLLIVTDGKHDRPGEKLSRIPDILECEPSELPEYLDWLT